MVICFFAEQAKQWTFEDMISFMLDANYKHILGTDQKEIIWAWYSHSSEQGNARTFNAK